MSHKLLVSVALMISFAPVAWAQDAGRLAPKTPPPNPPAQVKVPPPASQPSAEQVVVPNLAGLVFVQSAKDVKETSNARGIDVTKAPLLDSSKFIALVSPFVGHPLTVSQLNQICRLAVSYCQSVNRPVVDAIVPQQDVTSGTVQILVLEGHIGQIRAEGNRFFPSRIFTSAIRSKPGDEISQSSLLADVDWLNENPFHKTDLVLQPGAELGQTDLILQTEDHLPVRVYGGYENTGTLPTGGDRWLTGINLGNTLGLDDQLDYQFTAGDSLSKFIAHSASYSLPLPWRNTLTIFGNWSSSKVPTDPLITQTGQAWQISGRYSVPLPKIGGIGSSLVLGGDFKRTNTNADFGGTSVFASDLDIVQFMAGYDLTEADSCGSGDATLEGYFSPGYIGGQDNRSDYQLARPGADPQYAYARLSADRQTALPENFAWVTRFQGQAATGPLFGSEELGVGGMDSVRGYFEREGNGDDGIIFSNEIHTPSLSFLNIRGRKDQLYFLAFLDYGVAWMRDAQPGQFPQENFLGAGPGISYHLGPWLSIDYAYGWRIAQGDPTVHASGRNHLRVVASFTY